MGSAAESGDWSRPTPKRATCVPDAAEEIVTIALPPGPLVRCQGKSAERAVYLRAALVLSLLSLLFLIGPGLETAQARDIPDLGAVRRLLGAEEPSARAAALRRLAGYGGRRVCAVLLESLADPHPYVRRAAAGVLGTIDEAERPALAKALARQRDVVAGVAACRVLALWADARGRRALLDRLATSEPAVRAAAVRWLADDPAEGVGAALRGRLGDRDGEVRALAIDALVARGDPGPELASFLADPDWRVRLSALEGSVVGTPELPGGGGATVALLHGLDDAVWSVRFLAAELSGRVPDARLLPALVRCLSDPRHRVTAAAHESLVALTGIPFDPDPEVWTRWLATDGVDFDPAAREEHDPGSPSKPPRGGTVARPRFLGLDVASRHVAFVLDGSGSMARRLPDGRTRWQSVCASLDEVLKGLEGASGNVFVFRAEVVSAFEATVRLTPRRRKQVLAWLDGIGPGGKTALYDGLAQGLADPAIDTVILLSDGAPSAGRFFTKTDLLTEIRRLNRWHQARIDIISVGTKGLAKRWRDVLRRLAEESGGTWLKR